MMISKKCQFNLNVSKQFSSNFEKHSTVNFFLQRKVAIDTFASIVDVQQTWIKDSNKKLDQIEKSVGQVDVAAVQ